MTIENIYKLYFGIVEWLHESISHGYEIEI